MNRPLILLTGASRGLGLQLARTLLEGGYAVRTVQRTVSPELQSLADQNPDALWTHSIHLGNDGELERALEADFLRQSECAYAGFVNNAALAYDDLITNFRTEPLENMFRINVIAPILLTKAILRNMLLHSVAGSLVHISSISAHTGYKGLSAYAATKGAIEAFSRNTAREWGERKIRSNCVVCGFMETDMSGTLDAEQKQRIHRRTALKEATSLRSVASMAAYLLGPEAGSVTGQNFHVDAGTL